MVPVLIAALGDTDEEVRKSAAEALGQIGPAAAKAVPALIAALSDADKWARGAPPKLWGRLGGHQLMRCPR
jgi:HEAT repeat protein